MSLTALSHYSLKRTQAVCSVFVDGGDRLLLSNYSIFISFRLLFSYIHKVKLLIMSFRRDDREHTTADNPPMSRLFVICNKSQDENDFREAFSKFGEIEEIWVVQDKYTGENKGTGTV